MTPSELTIQALLSDCERDLELQVLAGEEHLSRVVATPELNRPGLAFAGFYDVFAWDRIQILGNTEISYLNSLTHDDRNNRLEGTLQFQLPCIIITNGNPVSQDIIDCAKKHGTPLLRTELPTTRLVGMLTAYLERFFAPTANVHGNLLDVFGMGVLIMGSSGVGKSECALELIERGHRLVADDQVIIRRLSKEELIGRSSDVLKYHMEIRGLGILNLELLFGVASVVEEKRIELVVWLERWNDNVEYERLGIDEEEHTIFDVRIPKYKIPVQPGRNISIMVEMAALTQRLKTSGINPAQLMNDSLIARMSGTTPSRFLRR
jgi:HPr kinase/phosphorylase